MRENNDLGIFDFDDFAMEMASTELLLVNGGACGGGFSGSSGGYSGGSCGGGGSYSGGYSGSYSGGSSSVSSSCGGSSGSYSGGSSSVSSSCGGSSGSYSGGSSSVSSSCGGSSSSYSGGSSSVSSSCGGSSSSYSGSSSSASSSCGGSFNGGSGTSVSYGNCGGGTIPISNNCGGGYTGSGSSYTSSSGGGGNAEPIYGAPTDSRRVTGVVGEETSLQKVHTGIDIGAMTPGVKGDPIYAVADGKIMRVGETSNSGSSILELDLPNTNDTAVYQHAEFIVKVGDYVKEGDIIGYMSDIGTPGKVHLHFEIRQDGLYAGPKGGGVLVNPLDYLTDTYKVIN